MNSKLPLRLSPLCICLLAGAAHADLEPYSLGASESIQHQSNINRTPTGDGQGDWLSVTEFRAALDQAIGRDRLAGDVAVDLNRYKKFSNRNSTTYNARGEFDWSAAGDLSGSFGGDSRRRDYFYGLDGETISTASNLETDNHVFTKAQLGGVGRWSIFAGADANERNYSNTLFDASETRQWSANGGTNYSTSPDLSFGILGSYTRGRLPHLIVAGVTDEYSLRSLDLTTKWQVSGASLVNAAIGYTTETSSVEASRNYANGSLNWVWNPPSRFSVTLGLARDSDADTAFAAGANPNNLAGRSLNNVAHIDVSYELTSKISLTTTAQYTQRKYGNTLVPLNDGSGGFTHLSGDNRTTRLFITAHYTPTRISDLSCGFGREVRSSDVSLSQLTPPYNDNTIQCTASVNFN